MPRNAHLWAFLTEGARDLLAPDGLLQNVTVCHFPHTQAVYVDGGHVEGIPL